MIPHNPTCKNLVKTLTHVTPGNMEKSKMLSPLKNNKNSRNIKPRVCNKIAYIERVSNSRYMPYKC